MGAETFIVVSKGATAKEAFTKAQEEARYEHGHGGYSGTIAEKRSFTMIADKIPEGTKPSTFAHQLLDKGDARVDDKWGPAGCIALGNNNWLFFGWASS